MMRTGKMSVLLFLAALVAGLVGCEKRDVTGEQKGPAEKAGQQIDLAAAKAGEQLNKMAEQAGKGLQAAGEKLQGVAQDAQKKQSDEPAKN